MGNGMTSKVNLGQHLKTHLLMHRMVKPLRTINSGSDITMISLKKFIKQSSLMDKLLTLTLTTLMEPLTSAKLIKPISIQTQELQFLQSSTLAQFLSDSNGSNSRLKIGLLARTIKETNRKLTTKLSPPIPTISIRSLKSIKSA